jgi:glycerophosphoryl diester phosphodiesterase
MKAALLAPLVAASMLFCLLLASPAPALQIHAHRGGANAEGAAAFGENSMPAFRNAAANGWVIELDLASTADDVAVVMHDDTLDRTTDCEGEVSAHTLAELAGCRIDRIGIGEARQDLEPDDPRRSPIPTLEEVLDLLVETGARANVETKGLINVDPSFAPSVYGQIASSQVPERQVIVQNFLPANLASVPALLPGAETSLLTPNFLNDSLGFDFAVEGGYDWVSPEWPVSREYVVRAHTAGFKVVPWTVDDPERLRAVSATGADAVITNDPALAERLVGPRPRLALGSPFRRLVLRWGKVSRISVKVVNTGDAPSRPFRVSVGVSGPAARLFPSRSRVVPGIQSGATRKITFAFRLKRKLRPGRRGTVRFSVPAAGQSRVWLSRPILVR